MSVDVYDRLDRDRHQRGRPVHRPRSRARPAARRDDDRQQRDRDGRREDEERRGAEVGGSRAARRSMPCDPAPAISPIDRGDEPDDAARSRRRPAGEDGDDDGPEAESVASQPTTNRPGAVRPSIVNVPLPGPAGGATPAEISGGLGLRGGTVGRRAGETLRQAGSALGQRLRAGGRPRPTRDGRRLERTVVGRRPGRWRSGGRSTRGRHGSGSIGRRRRPHAARSPCRTRRTATSPGRRAGEQLGRPD